MEKLAVLTSGGDAPGMNAAIRAIVRTACSKGIQVIGVRRGYAGLLGADFFHMNRGSVANIIQTGGTMLETTRCDEFLQFDARQRAIANLEEAGIDHLITIGGDGTFRGAVALQKEGGVKVVGVPCSIDNDVYGTDYTVGFDTAVNTALDAIDKIRDTARSLERLFFVEVMGRRSGFIAVEAGIAGGAVAVLVPEIETDIDTLCDSLVNRFKAGRTSAIVVVAEGDTAGGAFDIAKKVREKTGIDSRVTVIGHIQRGGAPTARDRVLASKLGVMAVEALTEGKYGYMVGEVKGKLVYTPLEETYSRRKLLDKNLFKVGENIS